MPNSGNRTHDTTCNTAEAVRQTAVATASNQAATRSAEITYYRACRASAIANDVSPTQFISALQELGTGGT